MKKSLSIAEWHEMSLSGKAPPVRIQLNGYSMNPLIRGYRDYVTVVQPEEDFVAGDIVLVAEPGTGRYVMHRVWEVKGDRILTWGDNCSGPDGWIPKDAVWGKTILIERGKKEIHPDPKKGIRWAKFWHQAGKVYRLAKRYKNGVVRRIKKLKA